MVYQDVCLHWTDRQTDTHTYTHTHTERDTDVQICRQRHGHTERYTGRDTTSTMP